MADMTGKEQVKIIEDLSLNAWPSHQLQVYDSWLLRFSYFYTHRTNCVEQIGASLLPLSEKLPYVEHMYREWGTPCIYKISPLLPPDFERALAARGYQTEHVTHNFLLPHVAAFRGDVGLPAVETHPFIPDAWVEALFRLKGTTNIMHKQVVPSMYRAIPKETLSVCVRDSGRVVGTGLGIFDRDYVGVYAIHVHPAYRRRHLARAIVTAILTEAQKRGVSHAYLQVVEGNTPAIHLYNTLGFEYLYTDSFRVKQLY